MQAGSFLVASSSNRITFKHFEASGPAAMTVTLVLLAVNVVTAFAETGGPRAFCPSPTIEAVEGEDVVLQCYLDPPHSVVKNAVDWKRVDLNKVVCSYRHGKENHGDQMSQYRGRATLGLKDLSGGNLSLRISSVQLNDSGPYRCFESRLRTSCSVNVTVVTKDQPNRTKRRGSTTTSLPLDEPDNPDGANRELVTVTPAVVLILCILTGAVVLVLVKCGTIQTHVTRLRGGREGRADANDRKLEPLKATEGGPDGTHDFGNNCKH